MSTSESQVIDALVYASIANNVVTDEEGINSIVQYASGILPAQTGTTIGSALNGVLSSTELKRACCLGASTINVRIPLPSDIELGTVLTSDVTQKKFNYYDKTVKIPQNLCPTGYNRVANPTDQTTMNNCDIFYKTYCQNQIMGYNNMVTSLGGTFNSTEFITYKPECACFVPPNYYGLANTGVTIVPSCWYPGCDSASFAAGQVWLDSVSRGTTTCDITICNDILNFNNLTAGGNITITPKITNLCGSQTTSTTAPVSGGTTTAPTTTPTTSSGTTTTPTAAPTTGSGTTGSTTTVPTSGSTTTAPTSGNGTTTTAPTTATSSSSTIYIIVAIVFFIILAGCSISLLMFIK